MAQGSRWRTAGVLIVAALVTVGFAYFTRPAAVGTEPHARAASAPKFPAVEVEKASGAVARLTDLGALRDITLESAVIVGPGFALAELETKRAICVNVMVARYGRGLSTDFLLKEPMSGRTVGYFRDGYLDLE